MNLSAFKKWIKELPNDAAHGGLPPRGLVASSLCVLERLRKHSSLDFSDHLTKGGGQIAGVSQKRQDRILERLGETRVYTKEGGRTNRGNHDHIRAMLDSIDQDGFLQLDDASKQKSIDLMQQLLFSVVQKHFALVRLSFEMPRPLSPHACISAILEAATAASKHGQVAQQLVAAKLRIRFPKLEIPAFPVYAQDSQTGRKGDIVVNDTAIHVTVAPNQNHYLACQRNVSEGMLALLLVPSRKVDGTRQFLADAVPVDGIAVQGIEEFVGQNIGEIAEFRSGNLAIAIGSLLREYNAIIDQHESDKSLMIEIPDALTIKP